MHFQRINFNLISKTRPLAELTSVLPQKGWFGNEFIDSKRSRTNIQTRLGSNPRPLSDLQQLVLMSQLTPNQTVQNDPSITAAAACLWLTGVWKLWSCGITGAATYSWFWLSQAVNVTLEGIQFSDQPCNGSPYHRSLLSRQ